MDKSWNEQIVLYYVFLFQLTRRVKVVIGSLSPTVNHHQTQCAFSIFYVKTF
jgi:hypothetical protein